MTRRLFGLSALVLLAVSSVAVAGSGAWFHSQSDSYLSVQAAHVRDWLHIYAQDTDPGGLTDYAIRRLSDPSVPAASGRDDAVVVDLGGFPDANQTFDLPRTITLMTPATLPEAGVGQVTVTVALSPDPDTGRQPLRNAKIAPIGETRGSNAVTMTAGQQLQVNVTVRSRKQFVLGQTMRPRVVLTLSYAGGPTGYYVYEIPMAVTNVGL